MKKKATVLIASIMAFCGINTAHADEGMWTIYNLPNAVYEMMQREGFSMTYDQLYNGENALKNAVVNFVGLLLRRSRFSRRFGILPTTIAVSRLSEATLPWSTTICSTVSLLNHTQRNCLTRICSSALWLNRRM